VPGEAVSYLELVTLPSAPFWARRQTRAALRSWRIWAETIETAELLVSELVTNAVKFTGPEPAQPGHAELEGLERISLILRYLAGQLIIEVSDPDPDPPVLARAGEDAEGGRGLMLVQALSKEWNYYLPPAGRSCTACSARNHMSPGPRHMAPGTAPAGFTAGTRKEGGQRRSARREKYRFPVPHARPCCDSRTAGSRH
jgi:anti-sigma regulatory factor (Ser/Thr protein kinase)